MIFKRSRPQRPPPPRPPLEVEPFDPNQPADLPIRQPPPPRPLVKATAVRFTRDADAITYLGLLTGPDAVRQQVCRRDPTGAVWLPTECLDLPGEAVTGIAQAAGGQLRSVPSGLSEWPAVNVVELAATVAPSAPSGTPTEVVVITSGALARSLVNECVATQLPVAISQVELRAVAGTVRPRYAMALRLGTGAAALPMRRLTAMAALPDTVVCRCDEPRLLIDLRARLPLAGADLAAAVPSGQRWLLGCGGFGAWLVQTRTEEVVPAVALPPNLAVPASVDPTPLPSRFNIDVELVADSRSTHQIDARLVRDEDLDSLRTFLAYGLDLADLYLMLGPGLHLVIEPGGLSRQVPYGIPVARYGRHGLYIQSGHTLRPRPPVDALINSFGLTRGTVVAVTRRHSCRFSIDNIVPAWSLWLGKVPDVTGGLSAAAARTLASLSEAGVSPAAESERLPMAGAPDREPSDRSRQLDGAVRLEQAGEFAKAAKSMEEVGEFARAAVLYRKAAERARGSR